MGMDSQRLIKYYELLRGKSLYENDSSLSERIDENSFMIIIGAHDNIDDTNIITVNDKSYNSIPEDYLEVVNMHKSIYSKKHGVNAILHGHGHYTKEQAFSPEYVVPPVVDDMAQIIGPDLKKVDTVTDVKGVNNILKKRNACLVMNNGGIAIGRSLQEVYVASQILEKSTMVYAEAKHIGGAKPIGKIVAYIMHRVYMKVYSKKSI